VGWEHVERWRRHRIVLPIGPFSCVLHGTTRGRRWSQTGARAELRRLSVLAGVRRRFASISAVTRTRSRWPATLCPLIQSQAGHAHLGVTSAYLQGTDATEIIDTIHARRPPIMPASAGLGL
jgi:hypothetical protein